VVFSGDEIPEGQGSYNFGYRVYVKKGVFSRKGIQDFKKPSFTEEFLKLNPKDSTYYKQIINYASYAPAIMISGQEFELSPTPVVSDEHNMHYKEPALELIFTNKKSRDRLLAAIEELYKACPSAK